MRRHVFIALGVVVAVVLIVLLFLTPATSQKRQAPFLPQLKAEAQWKWAELRYQWYLHDFAGQETAFQKAIESGRAVRIAVPYPPGQTGAGTSVQRAIESFVSSNHIAPVRFESAGSTSAQVRVLVKDAAAMSRFVNSMGDGANQHLQPTPR